MSIRPMYAVAIQEAIKSGDREAMLSAQSDAEAFLKEHEDVPAALESLKAKLAEPQHHTGIVPLYGVIIHEAIASGDTARMKEVLAQAEAQLAAAGDVRTGLASLREALGN